MEETIEEQNYRELFTDLEQSKKEAVKKIDHLLHLHACEQEGLVSGQPSPEQWIQAVEDANQAIKYLSGID